MPNRAISSQPAPSHDWDDRPSFPVNEILKATDIGLWYWDYHNSFMDWSDNLKQTLIADNEAFIPSMAFFLSHVLSEDLPALEAELKHVRQFGESRTVEFRVRSANKNYNWVSCQLSRMPDMNGKPQTLICGSMRNNDSDRALREELIKTKQELRFIFDTAPILMLYKDSNNNILRLNRIAAEVMETTVEEAEGKNLSHYFPKQASQFHKHDLEVMRSNVPQLSTVESFKFTGSKKGWALVHRIPYVNPVTEESTLVIFAQDITQQKDNDIRLRDSEARMSAIMDSMYDGYWEWRIEDDYEYMSPRFWEIIGVDPTADPDNPPTWKTSVFEEDYHKNMEAYDRHVKSRGKIPYAQEVRYHHADGSTVSVLSRGRVIEWDEDGKPMRMVGTYTDLTELKNNEIEKDMLTRRFEVAASHARIGIWEWPIDGSEPVWWSPAYHRLIGDEDYKITPCFSSFTSFLHPDDLPIVKACLREHLQNDDTFSVEFRHKLTDGSYKWFRCQGQVSRNEHGTPVRMLGSLVDIDNSKQNQTRLEEYNQKLEKANKELDHFAYIASHDLKAPLRGMDNVINWIAEDLQDNLTPDIENKINLVKGRVARMEQLLTDMLAFSRAGREVLDAEDVNIKTVIDEVVDWIGVPDGFSVTYDPDLPIVSAPLTTVQQIFLNLINNAIKHHDKDTGEVNIAYAREKEHHLITISDDGPGIEPQYHETVFGMFKKLKPRDEVEGSGIGLAIVRKTVESLGGKIWLESFAGQRGTKFYLQVPVCEQTEDKNEEKV